MTFGSRLVIPGAILGSLCLVLFLLLLTADVVYPPVALAAPPQASPAPSAPAAALSDSQAGAAGSPEMGGELPAGSTGCQVSDRFPPKILQWCDTISYYASQHGLHPDLVAALIWQESGGDAQAYSHSGAVGLMQVMPSDGLAASFICPNGPCFASRPSIAQLQDPVFNIAYGTKMLAGLIQQKGDLRQALKSYGPMNVGYYYADKVLNIFADYTR